MICRRISKQVLISIVSTTKVQCWEVESLNQTITDSRQLTTLIHHQHLALIYKSLTIVVLSQLIISNFTIRGSRRFKEVKSNLNLRKSKKMSIYLIPAASSQTSSQGRLTSVGVLMHAEIFQSSTTIC